MSKGCQSIPLKLKTMTKTTKLIKFGEDVEGYSIPVLNEREIRASAGILFVFMLISLMLVLFKGNFLLIKYVITYSRLWQPINYKYLSIFCPQALKHGFSRRA